MPTLSEIRSKYPQYGDMTDREFASAIHQKFYKDVPEDKFNAIVGIDIPDSLHKEMTAAANSGMKWLDVAKSFGGAIDDAARSVASGMTFGYADRIAAGMESLTGQGSYAENLKAEQQRTAQINPAIRIPGEIAGAATTAIGGAPIARAVGGVASAAAPVLSKIPGAIKAVLPGAVGGAAFGSSEGDTPTERAKNAAIGAGVGGAFSGAVTGVGKIIGATGDKIMTSVIKPSIADIKDGFSLDTVKKFNLGGSLRTTLSKTQAAMNSLSSDLKARLASSNASVDLTSVYDQTEKSLLSENKLKTFGVNTKIKSALNGLQNEVLQVGRELPIPEAQVVKQAAGHLGAWQYGKPDPESVASEMVYNTFYNKLKVAIENNSPDGVKEINQQLSKLIPVSNAVIRRLPVAERNNVLSLPEWIGLIAHSKTVGLSLLSRSGTAGNIMSKAGAGISAAAPQIGISAAPMLGRSRPFLIDAQGNAYK